MQFGIGRMADPSCDEPQDLRWETDRDTGGRRVLNRRDGHHEIPWQPNHACSELCSRASPEKAYVEFNLAWPIEAQLKRARRVLRVLQDRFTREYPERTVSKRKRESHYRTYLQLLDAEEGASEDEMAALLPEDLKIKGSDLGKAVKYSLSRSRSACGTATTCISSSAPTEK